MTVDSHPISTRLRSRQTKTAAQEAWTDLPDGPEIQEMLDEEEIYDADIEVVEPDAYSEAGSESEPTRTRSPSETITSEPHDWERYIIPRLRSLDCESVNTSPSRPETPTKKRKRDDGLSFFHRKHMKSRSPSPQIEVEEALSDEPMQQPHSQPRIRPQIRQYKSDLNQRLSRTVTESSESPSSTAEGDEMQLDSD